MVSSLQGDVLGIPIPVLPPPIRPVVVPHIECAALGVGDMSDDGDADIGSVGGGLSHTTCSILFH